MLLDYWAANRRPVRVGAATHFHADRTGGIPALKARGIKTYGNPLTIGLALDHGLPTPLPLHDLEKPPQRLASGPRVDREQPHRAHGAHGEGG